MDGEKPKTFNEIRKIVYSDDKYEIYQIDDDVYQIILQQPYVVIIYNFKKNVIYYTFSVSGYSVSQVREMIDWNYIRKIIQSSKP